MATVTGSKRHLDINSNTLTTSSNVDVGAKLFITTTDTNTTSTSALVLNSSEVETRTLGSNAFNSTAFLTSETFGSSDVVLSLSGNDIIAGTSITLGGGLSYNASTNTLSQTDNNTVYTHPTFNGDDFSIDTGALTGATVISDLDINITTNGEGHVTDANGSVSTRTLTLANLGYTGATNANYITNNNQLTNGAGYLTAETFSSSDVVLSLSGDDVTAGESITLAGGLSYSGTTLTSADTTYTEGDGGLTQKNFTTTLKNKLDGIAASATNVTNNNQLTNGAGYITGVSFANVSSKPTFSVNSMLSSRATTAIDTVGDSNGVTFNYSASNAVNKPSGTDHSLMTMSYSTAWQTQLAQDWRNKGRMYLRGQENGTWSSWVRVHSTDDFSTTDVANGVTAYGWGDHGLSAQDKVDIGNLSGTNTGDQVLPTLSSLGALSASGTAFSLSGNDVTVGESITLAGGLSYSGTTLTSANDNTTYTAGTGLTLTGTSFSVTANTYATAAQGATADAALPKSGGTMTGHIAMEENHLINYRFEMIDNVSPQYILLCRNAAANDVNGVIRMDRSSGNYQAASVEVIVSAGSSLTPVAGALRTLQVEQQTEVYTLVTVTHGGNDWIAIKYTGNTYPETSGAYFTGRLKSTGTYLTVVSTGITNETAWGGSNLSKSYLEVGDFIISGNVTLESFGAGYLKTNVNGVISNTATIPWSTVSSTPTTISGYGITDALAIGTTATTAMAGNTTIPTNNNQLTNGAGYLTAETFSSSDVVMSIAGNDLTAGVSVSLAGGLSYNASTNTLTQADNDTVYTHPTSAGNKHIPTGGSAGQFLKYSSSGTATWATPSYTTNTNTQLTQSEVVQMLTAGTNVTISAEGVIASTDTDTVYTHPTSAGNKHIPTGGAAGQFLKYSSSGTATWATPSYTTNTNTTYSAGTGLDLTGTTFSIEPDLRDGVTRIGKDTSNYIAIGADTNVIDFHVGGVWVARMESDGDLHMKGDVIAFSDIFNP